MTVFPSPISQPAVPKYVTCIPGAGLLWSWAYPVCIKLTNTRRRTSSIELLGTIPLPMVMAILSENMDPSPKRRRTFSAGQGILVISRAQHQARCAAGEFQSRCPRVEVQWIDDGLHVTFCPGLSY